MKAPATSWVMIAALGAALGAGACISVPDGPEPECSSDRDCDRANGEVCEESICWGNPPPGAFAALVSPPGERTDSLVSVELVELAIPPDGWVGDIALAEPVMYTGQLGARCPPPADCSDLDVGATITVTRPSQFAGGPAFRTEVTVEAGKTSFQIALPRTQPFDPLYTVTVVPDVRNEPGLASLAAQEVPPLRFQVAVPDDLSGGLIELGALSLATIEGTVKTAAGAGIAGYRVVALGKWDESAQPTEVSTVDFTGSDGKYLIRLSRDVVGTVAIVARPLPDVTALLPALHMANVPNTGGINRSLILPATLGAAREIVVPVAALGGSGEIVPVLGARVRVAGKIVPSAQPDASFATLVAEATTDERGEARLRVFDGSEIASTYKISIVPPASSESGVVFEDRLDLARANQRLLLPARVAVRGVIRDVEGEPVSTVQVTARPSLRFLWSLDGDAQSFLTAIPVATAVTPDTGEFVVWVDPLIAGIWGGYDLVFEPPARTRMPTFVRADIGLPRDAELPVVTLEPVDAPDAAFIHGRITDLEGRSVEGAELKLFRRGDPSLCLEVTHAPPSCPVPAALHGRGTADDLGIVRLMLPR